MIKKKEAIAVLQLANPHQADRKSLCSQPTPHLPPPTHGSGVGQTSIPATWAVNRPALTIYLPCIYIDLSPQ